MRRWKNPNLETNKEKDAILPVLSRAVLRSAWIEADVGVWRALRDPLLLFLRGAFGLYLCCLECLTNWDIRITAYPEAWVLADSAPAPGQEQDGDKDDDQDEDEHDSGQEQEPEPDNKPMDASKPAPTAYGSFLAFLPRPPAPGTSYPALVVILSTLPPSLLTPSATSAKDGLFDALWAGLGGGFGAGSGLAGFGGEMLVKAVLECLVFIVRGALAINNDAQDSTEGKEAEARNLVHAQFERTVSEFFEGRLRLSPTALGRELAGALGVLGRIGGGRFLSFRV